MTQKLCVTCKFYIHNGSHPICGRETRIDLVTGEVTGLSQCRTERFSGDCGEVGKFYQPAPQPVGFWVLIVAVVLLTIAFQLK